MSHTSAHHHHQVDDDVDDEQLELKPRARRAYEQGSDPPTPTDNTSPSSHFPDGSTPSRNRSFLNLTSSTLFGIYGASGISGTGSETIPPTPYGDGAQTPNDGRSFDFTRSGIPHSLPTNAFTRSSNGKLARRRDTNSLPPLVRRKTFRNFYIPLVARLATLFLVGTLYGSLIPHLHDSQHFAPANVALDRQRWWYNIVWGLIGMALGEALPWADSLWVDEDDENSIIDNDRKPNTTTTRRSETWLDAVRSIGLFVGIAFAIRKLPWQSSLQRSLTLALANPAIWYLIDRSPPGFLLSTVASLVGTVVTLGLNPALLPGSTCRAEPTSGFAGNGTRQSPEFVLGFIRIESVGVATWIASVLFVSSVCFGNVGRRLPGRQQF